MEVIMTVYVIWFIGGILVNAAGL